MYLFMRSINQMIWSIKHHPSGTHGYINIKNIKVSNDFLATTPKVWKVREYYKRYFQNGFIDEPITVRRIKNSKEIELVDGYIRYLICMTNIYRFQEEFNCTYDKVPSRFKYVPIMWAE